MPLFHRGKRIWLLVIILYMLAACASDQLPVAGPAFADRLHNACLPEAMMLVSELQQANIPAEILIIRTAKWSHAAAVFKYKRSAREKEITYIWDSVFLTWRIDADYDSPRDLANKFMNTNHLTEPLVAAYFM